MATIKATHYDETVRRLTLSPIVQEMATEIPSDHLAELAHPGGNPKFEFMLATTSEYARRVEEAGLALNEPQHIGAVAEAILRIRKEGV